MKKNRISYFKVKPITLSEGEFIKKILSLSKTLRMTEIGNGVNCASLMPTIRKAFSSVEKRLNDKEILMEYEKWLYENLYLVKRFVYGKKNNLFSDLPHVNGKPRVLYIAEEIVNNSLEERTKNRVELALESIKPELTLNIDELLQFNDAVAFASIELIYVLSKRILNYERLKKEAQKSILNERELESDIYCFYVLKNQKLCGKAINAMQEIGMEPKNARLNHNIVLRENNVIAESCFKILMQSESFVPVDKFLNFLTLNEVLKKDAYFIDMDMETKLNYLSIIKNIAKKSEKSELYVAKKLMELSEKFSKHIGELLYENKKALTLFVKKDVKHKELKKTKGKNQFFYVLSMVLFTIAATALSVWLSGNFWFLLGIIPIFLIVDYSVNAVLQELIPDKRLPKMNFTEVPSQYKTLMVVCEYVSNKEQLKDAIKHLLSLGESQKSKNLDFAMLIDFKSGENEKLPEDEEYIDYIESVFKDKNNFNVFIRKRVKIGKKYQAFERKRGAIMELNRFLVTGNDEKFQFILNRQVVSPRFVITLDSDSVLPVGGALELINLMSHPCNAKYDLIATQNRYNLYSLKSYYGLRYLNESGMSCYPNYCGLYYKLFGVDVFCGKGIYRLNEFYNALEGIIPSNKVLSHDILEGAILNTAQGGLTLEDIPLNYLADRERKKRWQRGDVQLLPFIRASWKNDAGDRYSSNVSIFYKFIIIKNLLTIINPIILSIIVLIGLFLSKNLLFFGLILFAIPYAINQLRVLRGLKYNTRLRYIFNKSVMNFIELALGFFTLLLNGVENAVVFISTVKRMITGKKTLEWKTYYSVQKSGDLLSYVRAFSPSLILAAAVCAALYFVNGILCLCMGGYVVCTVIFALLLYLSGKKIRFEKDLSAKSREYLNEIGIKTYSYFNLMRKKNGIIGDNFQVKPYKGESTMTSPTNIGFSVLAEISAYFLGIIAVEDAVRYITNILEGIEKLKKWRGNLYNWYDTLTLTPKSEFVSSVDSGNLLGCLLVASEFLREVTGEKNLLCEKLIDETELSALYDEENQLFYLGYNEFYKKYEGHYDMLASESRLLSLIYIAYGGRVEHWRKLRREYTSLNGNTLLSWSGTMFEYLMTDIFFRPPKFSLLSLSSKRAVKLQQRKSYKKIWGRSESGFYSFDDELRYQYHAFGLQGLSLRREKDENIISPYSSILALDYGISKVEKNLKNLEKMGAVSEFGFYEGVDLCGKKRLVSSYMTHHQGMIISSVCNALCDGAICRLFEKNHNIAGVLYLLNETQNENYFGTNILQNNQNFVIERQDYSKNINNLELYPSACALTNGEMSVFVESGGNVVMKYKKIYLNDFRNYYGKNDDKEIYYVVKNPQNEEEKMRLDFTEKACKNVVYSSSEISVFDEVNSIKEDICIADGLNVLVRSFSPLGADFLKGKKFIFYCPLIFSGYDDIAAHPTYQKLFISSEWNYKTTTFYFKKTVMGENNDSYYAIVIKNLRITHAETNRFNFIGRLKDASKPKFLTEYVGDNNAYPSFGDVLEPCLAFCGEVEEDAKSFELIFAASDSREKLDGILKLLPKDVYSYAKDSSVMKMKLSSLKNELLGAFLHGYYSFSALSYAKENGLIGEFFDINGRNKSLLYSFDQDKPESLSEVLRSVFELKLFEIDVRLLLIYEETYGDSVKKYLEEKLREFFISNYKLFEKNDFPDYIYRFAFLTLDKDLTFAKQKNKHNVVEDLEKSLIAPQFYKKFLPDDDALLSGNGYFFGKNGEKYALLGENVTALPYSHVICAENGGMVVTENGGGFFFFQNSRESKVNRFDFDVVTDKPSEWAFINSSGGAFRINCGTDKYRKTVFSPGKVDFLTSYNDLSVKYESYTLMDGRAKVNEISIEGGASTYGLGELFYAIDPCLDWKTDREYIYCTTFDDGLEIINFKTMQQVFIRVFGEGIEIFPADMSNQSLPYLNFSLPSLPLKAYIVLSNDSLLLSTLRIGDIRRLKAESLKYFESINNLMVNSNEKSFDVMANRLLYQVVSCRLNGKCGYYQVGGATGFRDQLQDVLALFHYSADRIREQILYCAQRQYEEGDVMHWWHHPFFGLRSKISDDKLFLPYVTAKYIEATEDYDILKTQISYMKSPVLSENEYSRVENPSFSDYTESLEKHCLRAIKSALRYGEHNLLLIGSGDWNDGLDSVGIKGRGESVVLSMFGFESIRAFSRVCSSEVKKTAEAICENLKKAIENFCFEDGQYKRIFGDLNEWFGTPKNPNFEIDILSQAFSVLSGACDKERSLSAMDKARSLIDREAGIIKLLNPPQNKKKYLGYISCYPEGIRENGGQYTHAAIWYLIALVRLGKQDEAFELFQMINPVEKCRSEERNRRYKGEPYVLSGDVYSNKDNYGRMGWSWYTGSAAWAYKLIFEEFYGILRRKDGIIINPTLPKALNGSVVKYNYFEGEFTILYVFGEKNAVTVEEMPYDREKTIKFVKDKNINIKVTVVQKD